jgi:FixJ family two-component response regulator
MEANVHNRLIAIVDDDESVRRSLDRALRAAGYRASTFDRVRPALEFCRVHHPACVVLDLHLPGESGRDLAVALEADGLRIPLIFISAVSALEKQTRDLSSVVACLQKPFDRGTLLEAVARAVA